MSQSCVHDATPGSKRPAWRTTAGSRRAAQLTAALREAMLAGTLGLLFAWSIAEAAVQALN
ncbi:hypothetical protein ACQW02_12410 [Humitalea sp. 24SJ18S-53]|uniref:hypothetical protein n=1 Tax=Humitalea sp. 24SJ18S-53 TaxID=3422307 RepID=UPI003D671E69